MVRVSAVVPSARRRAPRGRRACRRWPTVRRSARRRRCRARSSAVERQHFELCPRGSSRTARVSYTRDVAERQSRLAVERDTLAGEREIAAGMIGGFGTITSARAARAASRAIALEARRAASRSRSRVQMSPRRPPAAAPAAAAAARWRCRPPSPAARARATSAMRHAEARAVAERCDDHASREVRRR